MASGFAKGIGIKRFLAKVFTDELMSGLLVATKVIQFIAVAYNGFPALFKYIAFILIPYLYYIYD